MSGNCAGKPRYNTSFFIYGHPAILNDYTCDGRSGAWTDPFRWAPNGVPGAEEQFAIRLRDAGVVAPGEGFHVAFRAPTQEAARAFHRAALEQGGQDNGGVGFHPEHGPGYFAAFVLDPDGHRIEAVVDAQSQP